MRTAVAETLVGVMESLDLKFPTVSEKQKKGLEQARTMLNEESGS